MELTTNQRPFLYFPLRRHFEQNFHLRHRLDRYGAGTRMDFDEATPEMISDAIAREIGSRVDYRNVEADGAKRATALRDGIALTGRPFTRSSVLRRLYRRG